MKSEDLTLGAQVRHATLGEGNVTAFDKRTVIVDFDGQVKMLGPGVRVDLVP